MVYVIDETATDPRIQDLVDLLNRFPGITTVGSCGGHDPPVVPTQAIYPSWYVIIELDPVSGGWRALQTLQYAYQLEVEFDRMTYPDMTIRTDIYPDLSMHKATLRFRIEGKKNPERLVRAIGEALRILGIDLGG